MTPGACLVSDPHGIVESEAGRYIYGLFSFGSFWRYDVWTDAWQQLAPQTVGGLPLDPGTCMAYDTSHGGIWAFMQATGGGGGNLYFYTCATDTWSAALCALPGGATGGAILHPCTAFSPVVSDLEVYIVQGGSVNVYRYTAPAWPPAPAAAPVVVVTLARGGIPGPGVTLDWLPTRNINTLYSLRGDGTATLDALTLRMPDVAFPVPGWAVTGYVPPAPATAETFSTGTCSTPDPITPGIVYLRNGTMRLREFYFPVNTTLPAIMPVGTFPGTDGVAHVGQAIVDIRSEDGTVWYYFAKHSQNAFMRVQRML